MHDSMNDVNGMNRNDIKIRSLFDLSHTVAGDFLAALEFPHEALAQIPEWILKIGAGLDPERYDHPSETVWVAKSATVAPSASITGPCIIGENTEVRHCAFIRGNALVGDGAVVGNSTELKNVILFDGVQVPHYNYVGDSILGYRAHMGAGAVTSNVKSDKKPVVIKGAGWTLETGRKKVGAMLGDFAEIGCGSVLNPGTVVGRGASVYPLSSVRGVVPENAIYKARDNIVIRRKEE